MIKREKSFLSFSHYVHYTMIKREKGFFWFNHYVNYARIKKKKVFFPIRHYVDYPMIKRKIFSFILFLRSLHHDQERKKNFFDLVATLTRPWSRDNFFFHLVPLFTTPWSREICFCISALHSLRQCHQKKKRMIFVAPRLWLRYDHRKISFFSFSTTFTMHVSCHISLRH